MSTRRELLAVLGLASVLAALPSLAQQQRHRLRRIGYLSGETARTNAPRIALFLESMAELGWVAGRDFVLDARYGEGVSQAYVALADALVATRPDLLLTPGDEGVRALVRRNKAIPVVVLNAQDPVGSGYAASLQRPGVNVTGLTSLARDLGAKRLQLLKEAFPRIAHVGVLFVSADASGISQVQDINEAATRLGIHVTPIELRRSADIEPAFQRGAAVGADAYMDTQSFLFLTVRRAIVDGTSRAKVPALFSSGRMAEGGGLMSYGFLWQDNVHQAAKYADKILKGAKPSDLPIEQPTKFELVLNMKTARAMGFMFPQAILLRADRVIE